MADYLPWTVPPFCKGRLGGIFYSLKDRLQHRLCLSQPLSVVETQDFQSVLRDPCPLGVVLCLSEFQMLSSVEFDDQFHCRCIKISDVVADGFLPIELHAKNLFSPQAVP